MPTYDNAWLRAREQRGPDQVRDIMHSPEEQARRRALADGDGSDPVAEARAFLSGSRLDPINVRDVAETDRRINAGVSTRRANEAENTRQILAGEQPLSMRGMAESLGSMGRGAQIASIVPSPASIPLSVGGTLATLPELGLNALQGGENAPGAGSAMMALLGLAPGVRGLAKAGQAATQAGVRAKQGADLRNTFRIGAKFQQPVAEAVKTGAAKTVPSRTLGFSDQWLRDLQANGARTVPPMRPELQAMGDGEDTWSAFRTLATRKETAAGDPFGSVKDLVGGPSERAVDLTSELAGLSTLDRAAQQARAQQRFGRVFRSE